MRAMKDWYVSHPHLYAKRLCDQGPEWDMCTQTNFQTAISRKILYYYL
jgi:hypothetical protein